MTRVIYGKLLNVASNDDVMALPHDARPGERITQRFARARGNFGVLVSRGLVTI